MTSSSGYITEFNPETNYGLIQTDDESNKRCLKFHLYSLKKNSRRYVNEEGSTFVGELFDFHIVQRLDGTEDEAINIRHRVLMCPIPGCARLKAFTSKNSLDVHVQSKHNQEKKSSLQVDEIKPKPPKQKAKKVEPFIMNFSTTSAAVIGRFIGKQGVNLKEFQKEHKVALKILTSTNALVLAHNPKVQIRVKPLKVNVNVTEVNLKLKSLWEKSVREQQYEENQYQRARFNRTQIRLEPVAQVNFDSDTRRQRAFTISGDDSVRRRPTRHRHTEAISVKQRARSSLALEGHRCAATGDLQQGGTKPVPFQEKKKVGMKDKQWLVKEQLDDLSFLDD
ncbi:unnamed protein product [Adineta ricciae]|uniref:Uncharacterized protein n=1 Tax=Adineta ricciae TaxID=249248 RepID=A0A816D010_ADIRI|nr:unnamed protein product [Adineta ricciae]CAF1630540.1 unnamed protein product [Adineta ricciae]